MIYYTICIKWKTGIIEIILVGQWTWNTEIHKIHGRPSMESDGTLEVLYPQVNHFAKAMLETPAISVPSVSEYCMYFPQIII